MVGLSVANVAYRKESFVSNKLRGPQKRHSSSPNDQSSRRWVHGRAGRAVDGRTDQSFHTCVVLDNFYVDRPVWMVDLRHKTTVSGVIIVTGQTPDDGNTTGWTLSKQVKRRFVWRIIVNSPKSLMRCIH